MELVRAVADWSECVCVHVWHWVVLLLESHWRAVKVLRAAGRIITVQVCACKPSKQSAGCEREVMHHWRRNTNTELCLVCPPVSLLGLSSSVLSHDLLPCKFRRLQSCWWKYSNCDRHIWNWLWAFVVCAVIKQVEAHTVHDVQNKRGSVRQSSWTNS